MNRLPLSDEELVRLLRRCPPSAASAELRDRSLAAARAAWTTADEPPTMVWVFPVVRLAVALAASLMLVAGASWWGSHILAPWQASDAPAAAIVADINSPAAMLGLRLPPPPPDPVQAANGLRSRAALMQELLDSPRPEGMPRSGGLRPRQGDLGRACRPLA